MNAFCVHCHFHQPPRENPYTGFIPLEGSALPFENWNERIFRESYLPNLYAHYVQDGKLRKVLNNYQKVSFNFTGSLLLWLAKEKRWFLDRLKEASKNALASTFNHTILPLDPPEDAELQIVWGIRLYEHFFGRKPKGFWLPELAVDRKTLSLLVKHGISYTILAPHQVNRKGSFLRHYLPEGHIDLFIYDGGLSHEFAFGQALNDVRQVIERTKRGFFLVAVDGETFGHHKKFGEMGLAYLLENHPFSRTLEELYGSLKPEGEGGVVELTSWSCVHGVERWRSDCGCSAGGMPGWHQGWRAPLREALEFLRTRVKERLFPTLEKLLKYPQRALFDFVYLIIGALDREEFLKEHAKRELSTEEKERLFSLLNAYKYSHLSFSSDGWFFAELSGLETVKNLLFAKRAIDLLQERSVEEEFLRMLSDAPSNLQAYGNGLGVWQKLVLPQVYDEKTIAQSLIVLNLAGLLEEEGRLGSLSYRIEGFERWRVYLFDEQRGKAFEFLLDLRDFDLLMVPQPFLSRLLSVWFSEYAEGMLRYTKDKELLLERLWRLAKDAPFDLKGELEEELKDHLRISLYIALKRGEGFGEVAKVLEKAQELGINLMDTMLKFWLERYIEDKVRQGLKEEEALLIAKTIRELNRWVGRYELMVDLWALKNWLWDNRDRVKNPELYQLLDCDYT